MATTLIALQTTSRQGLQLTTQAAASGDGNAFDNSNQDVLLFVNNGGGGSINVSVDTPESYDGIAIPAQVIAVPAGQARYIGPFPSRYSQVDTDNNLGRAVKVTYSGVTSVTVACIKVGSLGMGNL